MRSPHPRAVVRGLASCASGWLRDVRLLDVLGDVPALRRSAGARVTGSRPGCSINVESRAIARCAECDETWLLTLTLSSNRAARVAEWSITKTIAREAHLLGRLVG